MAWVTDHGWPHSMLDDWSEKDVAKLHAYLLEEATRCGMCGTQPYEWDPDQGGKKHAYRAVKVFCHGCYAKQALADDDQDMRGTTIQLAPETPELLEQERQAHRKRLQQKAREKAELRDERDG